MKVSKLFAVILWLGIGLSTEAQNVDFKNWPEGKSPKEIGLRIANKFLKTGHSKFGNTQPKTPPSYITYPDVCAWIGGLWFADATRNKELFRGFKDRFTPLFGEEKNLLPKPNHVDNNVFGSVPLELYIQTGEQKYLDLGLHYANTQWKIPNDAKPKQKAYADKGYSWQTRIWIDDMFMITAVQAQAFRATKDEKYINRAAEQMVLYLDKIQLENGLFYHAPQAPFCWGRGNGWMAVGMAELLRVLPKKNTNYEKIMFGYKKMMSTLLRYQTDEGLWRQVIDDDEFWLETSGTAMFTYAIITGVKNGWLDRKTYEASARKAWLALTEYVNDEDNLREVCAGTNIKNSRDHYINRPRIVGDLHGQAPLLWCATAFLKK